MVSLQQASVMKQLTQGLVDTELVFYLNGVVHGQRVFEQDLLIHHPVLPPVQVPELDHAVEEAPEEEGW